MSNLIESYSQISSGLISLFSSVFFYLLFHYLHKKKIYDIILTPEISQEIMSLVDAIVISIIGVLCMLNTNRDSYYKFKYTFFNNYFVVGYYISHGYIEYKHNLLKPDMILHHMITILFALSFYDNSLWYISNILNGLGHIPTIFLCNFQIFRQLPDYKKKYHNFYRYNKILFAITFFIFKVGGYTYCCFIHEFQIIGKIFLFSLTILQYYWGYLICKKVYVKYIKRKYQKRVVDNK